MGFDIEDEFFVKFISAMQNHGVRYMLIGGVAIDFQSINMATRDMSIFLAPTNENRDLFYKVLLDLGYTDEEIGEIKTEDFTNIFECIIGEMPYTIDCLTVVYPSINFDDAEQAMIKNDIGNGLILNVVDYEYLRKMKLLTNLDILRLDEFKKRKE